MVTKLRLNNLVYTIAMLIALRGIPYIISESSSASQLGKSFTWLGGANIFTISSGGKPVGVQVSIIFIILTFLIAHLITRYTQFGRKMYAVGSNRDAAEAAGIRPNRIIIIVYVISGLCSAIAALLLAGRMDSATMGTGKDLIFRIQAAAIIGGISLKGGRGSILGAFGGVLLWGILESGLLIMMVSSFTIDAVLGGLLLLAIFLDSIKERYLLRKTNQEQLSKSPIGLADKNYNIGFKK